MLAAEAHGKISDTSPPNQRMEDVLTSNVLSMFCYLSNLRIPTRFLSMATNLKDENFNISPLKIIRISFWPRFFLGSTRSREADALLILEEENGMRSAAAVEAKYESGLSNLFQTYRDTGKEQDGSDDAAVIPLGHQLADEFCGIKCGHWDLPDAVGNELEAVQRKVLLYITANYDIPKVDIKEAWDKIRISRKCIGSQKECSPESDIYWVSWRGLYRILQEEKVQGFPGYSIGEHNYLADLIEILALRGLQTFEPFKSLDAVDPYSRFFTLPALFDKLTPVDGYNSFFKRTTK